MLIPAAIALVALAVTGVHCALARVHGTIEVRRAARESLAEAAERPVPIAGPPARAAAGDGAATPLRLADQAADLELAALVDAVGTVVGANDRNPARRALADLEPPEAVAAEDLAALAAEPADLAGPLATARRPRRAPRRAPPPPRRGGLRGRSA